MSQGELMLELDSFQGPFDLLLHLIKQMEVDINDIPMAEITSQYLQYIQSMQELELDIVGDYLIMAATLLEIKSRMLLPVEPDSDLEDNYEDGNPRENLIQQLLLYQQFQTAATQLELQHKERAANYTRPLADITDYQAFIPLAANALSLEQLTEAMEIVFEKYASRQPLEREVEHDTLTVSDQINKIYDAFAQIKAGEGLTFDSLIQQGSRSEIVTTFLAMLELVKKQKIRFIQAAKDMPIQLIKIEETK